MVQLAQSWKGILPISMTEQLANLLRQAIMDGAFKPGAKLSEDALAKELQTSRNTLREAFRVLEHEGLIERHVHRGVFIRSVDRSDVRELFEMRKALELTALRLLKPSRPANLEALNKAIRDTDFAARSGNWVEVGSANLAFHEAIVSSAGNARMTQAIRTVLAQMRLVFQTQGDQEALHRPYLCPTKMILRAIEAGDMRQADRQLATLLDAGETTLLRLLDEL